MVTIVILNSKRYFPVLFNDVLSDTVPRKIIRDINMLNCSILYLKFVLTFIAMFSSFYYNKMSCLCKPELISYDKHPV